jgi:hypothetical protein
MTEIKDVDVYDQPHECRARDGGPVGPRVEACGDGMAEVIYPCAAPGKCPWRDDRTRSEGQ